MSSRVVVVVLDVVAVAPSWVRVVVIVIDHRRPFLLRHGCLRLRQYFILNFTLHIFLLITRCFLSLTHHHHTGRILKLTRPLLRSLSPRPHVLTSAWRQVIGATFTTIVVDAFSAVRIMKRKLPSYQSRGPSSSMNCSTVDGALQARDGSSSSFTQFQAPLTELHQEAKHVDAESKIDSK